MLALNASANTFTFDTPTGAKDSAGDAVDASAVFITGTDTLTITLTDLLKNPGSVGQLISDISFGFSRTISSSGVTFGSASGTGVTVNNDGTTSPGTVPSDAWQLDSANHFHISALGGGQPKGLIIGPPAADGKYDATGDGSIAGNKPHNPFYSGSATFVLNIPGLTSSDIVNSAIFSFGTTAGDDVTGIPQVPDGATTILLLGTALSGLGLIRRKLS